METHLLSRRGAGAAVSFSATIKGSRRLGHLQVESDISIWDVRRNRLVAALGRQSERIDAPNDVSTRIERLASLPPGQALLLQRSGQSLMSVVSVAVFAIERHELGVMKIPGTREGIISVTRSVSSRFIAGPVGLLLQRRSYSPGREGDIEFAIQLAVARQCVIGAGLVLHDGDGAAFDSCRSITPAQSGGTAAVLGSTRTYKNNELRKAQARPFIEAVSAALVVRKRLKLAR